MKPIFAILGMSILSPIVTVLFLILTRSFVEARYIPSTTMEPTLQVNDRVLVEKVHGIFRRPYRRGEIIVFYPPPIELGGEDLHNDWLTILGRLTGLPFLPYEPAFIKRVVGLPGDRIRIQGGTGVFLNGKLLSELEITKERPDYDLKVLSDIGGLSSKGAPIHPYVNNNEAIIVPLGYLFVLGDNRNHSEDSHVWGFLDERRIIGRAFTLLYRRTESPIYPSVIERTNRPTTSPQSL